MKPGTPLIIAGLLVVIAGAAICLGSILSGDGGMKRMTTISGVYAVCTPGGYQVVCFMEKGNSGIDCMPLMDAGGVCL
jgi:hypothetical protein